MTTQHVDYAAPVPGATLDTGGTDAAAIRPILNGEPATQQVFQRPDENLRTRTEVARVELEALKYLTDADRAMVALSSGPVTWRGVALGNFTLPLAQTISLRPFLAPLTSTRAKAIIRGVIFQTNTAVVGSVNPPRAYSGANKISVQLQGTNSATLAIAISGSPANKIVITVNTHPTSGTTKQALVDFLNTDVSALPYRSLGCGAALDTGAVALDKVNDTGVFVASDFKVFAGAADAETHIITSAGLANFFADPANAMVEGDVLAIGYATLVNGAFGGRRESLADAPESGFNIVDNNLFLLRRFPEKLPIAIPVASVISGDRLLMADNTFCIKDVPTLLTGGAAPLPAVVLPDTPAKVLRMKGDGNHFWTRITADMISNILSISAFSPTTVGDGPSPSNGIFEIGRDVVNPTFVATTVDDGGDGPTTANLTNSENITIKNVQPDFGGLSTGAFSSTANYVKNSPAGNGTATFTLTAADADTPAVRTTTLNWFRRVYFGFSATDPGIGGYNNTFVKGTIGGGGSPSTRSLLRAGKAFSFSLPAPGVPSYVFIAYPARHGALTSIIDNSNGLPALGGFIEVDPAAAGITTENTAAISESYRVYRSNSLQTGSVNFTVS